MHVFVDAESKRWFSRSFESFHIAMFDLPCPWTAVKLAAAGQSPTWPVHNLNPSTTCDQTWVDFCQLALEGKRRSDRVRANLSCSAVAYRAKIPLRHVVCPHQEFHPNELPQKCLAMSSAPYSVHFYGGSRSSRSPRRTSQRPSKSWVRWLSSGSVALSTKSDLAEEMCKCNVKYRCYIDRTDMHKYTDRWYYI